MIPSNVATTSWWRFGHDYLNYSSIFRALSRNPFCYTNHVCWMNITSERSLTTQLKLTLGFFLLFTWQILALVLYTLAMLSASSCQKPKGVVFPISSFHGTLNSKFIYSSGTLKVEKCLIICHILVLSGRLVLKCLSTWNFPFIRFLFIFKTNNDFMIFL